MLTDLLKKTVWKKPEEGKHTLVIKKWACVSTTSKTSGEVVEYVQCDVMLDDKREMTQNFFERDLSYLSSALVNKYFEEGISLIDLLDRCVKESTAIECWIKYNTDANGKEYTNYYWFEPKEQPATEEDTLSEAELAEVIKQSNLPL